MRISDWSSDVCSSDLSAVASGGYNNYLGTLTGNLPGRVFQQAQTTATVGLSATIPLYQGGLPAAEVRRANALESQALDQTIFVARRSEERRVGKECVSTCRSRWSRSHSKKKNTKT